MKFSADRWSRESCWKAIRQLEGSFQKYGEEWKVVQQDFSNPIQHPRKMETGGGGGWRIMPEYNKEWAEQCHCKDAHYNRVTGHTPNKGHDNFCLHPVSPNLEMRTTALMSHMLPYSLPCHLPPYWLSPAQKNVFDTHDMPVLNWDEQCSPIPGMCRTEFLLLR